MTASFASEGWSALASAVRTPSGQVHRELVGTTDGSEPLTKDHLFDLASLTKVFTAIAVHAAIDDGLLGLDQPIAEIVNVAAVRGGVTAHHLLTHTAGLRAGSVAWRTGANGDTVLADVLDVAPLAPPGAVHEYSCLGFIVLGIVLENLHSQPLDRIVLERVAAPLGATTLCWGPISPAAAVATEHQPLRGRLRGSIHDELAASIGRPVGNTGLFGTLDDVEALATAIASRKVPLSSRAFALLTTPDPAAEASGTQAHGLRVGLPTFARSPTLVGHTGFTGTSFVADTTTGAYAVLLTNRVHAGRAGTSVEARRLALSHEIGDEG
ncbi:serine hydrolase domain-containing protein [Cryobacterium sp. PH31-L1]|uniref:serine hydrolase domain-containing protein n=1 Tax=Cryobacterium sp. PH31-L1 TaxID=3046199 RepID=UPI0024B975AE|nr:serine hydrolase domain-containing protein [Cryobacterium sp. PH31-L1]MDJ0376976.1 serine hydrolase domain-containing protein [Cryobacterium sp. PH31-L1]